MRSQRPAARAHSHARSNAIGRRQDDADRWRAAILAGFAIVAGLIVPLWLQGYATGKFWIVWPLAPQIIVVTALAAAIQSLAGRLGGRVVTPVIIESAAGSRRRSTDAQQRPRTIDGQKAPDPTRETTESRPRSPRTSARRPLPAPP
jgi:hypothetical protein